MSVRKSSSRPASDVLPGVGIAVGAGAGAAVGVAVAGGPGIAVGTAIGAGIGVVIGAVMWSQARDKGQRSDAPR
jgi:hypothetical protein